MISGPISGPPDDNPTTTNDIDNNTDTNNDTNINVPYTTPTTLPHELSMLTELSNLFAHQHSSTAALINQVKASIDGLKYDFENYKKRIAREMKEKEDEIHSLRVLVGSGGGGGPADFAGRSDDEGGIPNYASGARKKMFKYKDDVEEEVCDGPPRRRRPTRTCISLSRPYLYLSLSHTHTHTHTPHTHTHCAPFCMGNCGNVVQRVVGSTVWLLRHRPSP